MKLPIPYEYNGQTITDVEFVRPRGGQIAEVKRLADDGDTYASMVAFIAGASTLSTESGAEVESKPAVKAMPYLDAEWCSLKILLLTGASDYYEGLSVCPRCSLNKTFDGKISAIPVSHAKAVQLSVIELNYPVRIIDEKTKETAEQIDSLTFRLPTLGDCIHAANLVDPDDQLLMQYAVYAEAIVAVNGRPAPDQWKGEWGNVVIGRMDPEDLRKLADETHKYGLRRTIPLRCSKCKRAWEGEIDTSGFFSSGLHGGTS